MKPHILVTTWFFTHQPGYLDFSYRLRALASRYRLTVVIGHEGFREEFPGLEADFLVLPAVASTSGLLRYLMELAALSRRLKPDLVIMLGSQMAMLSLLMPGMRTLTYWNEHPSHFYDLDHRNPLKRAFNRLLYRLSYLAARHTTRVMPIGQAHADDLRENAVPEQCLRLIPMGVADAFLAARKVDRSKAKRGVSVVYAGSVVEDRGRDVMIDGLKLARDAGIDVHLTLIGAHPPEKRYCSERAEALGLTDCLTVIGRIPGSEIPARLGEHDAGICIWADRPWWRFNPPTKLFEYLVAGLPVLASRIRTHTDYLRDGETGLIFDYDAASFAEALARLAADTGQRKRMKQQAAAEGKQYLWRDIEPVFIDCVETVLHG